ncbi:DNA damage-inducible protein D [Pannonibacter sp. SL95]|uniref:DNA damage-inducible protein D n=1 Tax=Pannonibacter sp. SL95 TaxID=2995153 RepID=UPI00227327BC|nr:DNA damage-inducible protein D [Pannonibacter sp. SL95]MCY1704566.1 DNA damage-inducible protein D [Pannonibacter sp. SL95]
MSDKLTGMNFDEALKRLAKTDPKELSAVTQSAMPDGEIEKLIAAFEAAVQFDQSGVEFWSARDLQALFEYAKWENFETALRRAMISCQQSGQPIAAHWLPDVRKSISGKGRMEDVTDYKMTRYACYLTAQNSDAKKKPVAFAQSYFAIQTRKQELADQAVAVPQSEDEKRVFLRQQIKQHNIKLSSAAKDAGVVTSQEFAIFHGQGWQGMYAMNVAQIRAYKGLPASADILDRMGSTELAANFFRVTQTEERLRKEGVKGKQKAYSVHFEVGRQVRDAMLKISKIAPEDLPAVENISQAEKRIKGAAPKSIRAPEAKPSSDAQAETPRPIDLRLDLWKYALLVMATKPNGQISTSDLIGEIPNYISVPDDSQEVLTGRKDSKFSQLVRNLKSHKTAKTNFIYQGYAEDVAGGFRITPKGRDFVATYFS